MTIPTITVERVGVGKALKVRHVNKARRSALWQVADAWHVRFRPIHFTVEGARRYNYRQRRTKRIRSGSIRKTKAGKPLAPSGLPLVWSGRSRVLSQQKKIRATKNWSKVTSPVRALNFRPQGWPPGQMAKEYRTVVSRERRKLQSVATQTVAKEFRGSRVKSVVRI